MECEAQGCDQAATYHTQGHYYCDSHGPQGYELAKDTVTMVTSENHQDAAAMAQAVQMASFIVGPVLANPELVNQVRDQGANALTDAGIMAVEIIWSDPNRDPVTLGATSLVEVFLSEMAAAFGFAIDGFTTLESATLR
jgi:hypothetical protein